MSGASAAGLPERIDRVVDTDGIKELVRMYFDPSSGFAGATFDQLGENQPDRFTDSDMLALNLLDEQLGPAAIRAIDRGDLDGILAEVSRERHLWQSDESDIYRMKALHAALRGLAGVGPTKAAKLAARKRPRLIPIYDSVVERVMQPDKGGWWTSLAAALDDGRRRAIENLDPKIPGYQPTVLRLLDAAIWMGGSNSRSARQARLNVGLRSEPLWP